MSKYKCKKERAVIWCEGCQKYTVQTITALTTRCEDCKNKVIDDAENLFGAME